ncbi:MAG: PLP-dependent transferase [Paracoccaceae bacterium]|nr:PLP-dependent transferase [Paracoccaceae bacterium]
MTTPDDLHLATLLSAAFGDAGGTVTPPIYQTSLYTFDTYQAFEDRLNGRTSDPLYSRIQNPTVSAFESVMAKAERGEAAVGFASGMAAISSTLLAFLKPGDRIAVTEHVYSDAYRLFEQLLRPFGIDITYHAVSALENDPSLLKGVKIAYLETANSLMLQPANLPKIAANAKAHGTITITDNSWASPVFQQPLTHGIDIVLHSASKYISGHSDTVAGVVVASDALIGTIRQLTLPLLGAKLAPFEAWLLVRGLRTLDARMRQHQATAELFIDRLATRPEVIRLHSPGANSVPGLAGRSGLLSIELAENVDIPRLADALKLFRLGVSWGGFESLILPIRAGLGRAGDDNAAWRFDVPHNLVRLSLGLENADDLWTDFEAALNAGKA